MTAEGSVLLHALCWQEALLIVTIVQLATAVYVAAWQCCTLYNKLAVASCGSTAAMQLRMSLVHAAKAPLLWCRWGESPTSAWQCDTAVAGSCWQLCTTIRATWPTPACEAADTSLGMA
jgi:hypothetical protein